MRRRSGSRAALAASREHRGGTPIPLDQRQLSVLAVTPIFDNGGTEVQLLELGRALLQHGDSFRLVTGGGTRLDDLPSAGIAHRLVRQTAGDVPVPIELVAYATAILRELLAEPADVIQSTSIRTTYAAALAIAAQALCRPTRREPAVVTTLHGGKQVDLYGRAARHLRRLSDAVVVVSDSGRDALIARGYPSDRVTAVPPGRDLEPFISARKGQVAAAQITGVPPTARVVLTVGRLAPLKGLRYLLDAWRLVASMPDVYLVIVGNGELESELKAYAAALGIEQRVVFAGFRSDVPSLLARADVFVLSSLWEGLPMAAVEAMAAGCPVVATAVGGTPEVVEDGVTGLLVPPQDAPALAEALVRVLTAPDISSTLATAAADRVQIRYTREALLAATRAVYLKACERRLLVSTELFAYEA